MNGCDLATMYEPLKCPRMNLEHGRRLMAVKQRLTVDPAIRDAYVYWWFLLIGHEDSFATEPYFFTHKRGSRIPPESSNENLGERHSFME